MLALIFFYISIYVALGSILPQLPLKEDDKPRRHVSKQVFDELEELARIVDISYCVGSLGTGISKPFECAGRCSDFENFELIKVSLLINSSCKHVA